MREREKNTMDKRLEAIKAYVQSHRDEMIALWRDLVNLEGNAPEVENLDKVAQRLKEEFEKTGMDCRLADVGPNAGKYLVGTIGADRPGKPVIFSGHFDTVFAKGTFGANPFRIEDGKAYGPGALDMKGGIVISLYVIKALESIGFNEHPIKVIYVSDEEIGHRNSSGSDLYLKEGEGGICAFNMETGLVDGRLCVGRKAAVFGHCVVTGVESHAGNDFPSGRNAIEEMAYKIIDLQKLTDLDKGSTVTCSVIQGGTVQNAIPGRCEMKIDMRFEKMAEMNRVMEAAKEICAQTHVEGTSTQLELRVTMPVFEVTDAGMNFYNMVHDVALENGFGEVGYTTLGGGSDASYLTMAGTPSICSFGVQGQWNHTDREYAVVESLFTRTEMIVAVILNLGRLK